MTSQDKLIKQGIKYTDALFEELSKRLANGVRSSDTLEAFLSKYKEYTDGNGENNPLVVSGYKDQMLKIILSETNNHRFSRSSQKEMVRVVIENRVGDLIVDVGEDVRENVRDIVKDGYNNELSQDEIAEQITQKVSSIKNRRARAIARTEIARTAVTSDYIISKERGATHFYVECRNTACPVCKQAWHKGWTLENDDTFNPKDTSAGGKGWIGDRTFSMNDVQDLPPKHPNCRCVPYFYKDKKSEPIQTTTTQQTTTTVTEPEVNPRISELEKEIEDVQAMADKWRKRGNSDLAKTFENDVKQLQEELNQLKNPSQKPKQQPTNTDEDVINNILADVLKDVGLEELAPEKKSISPDVKIKKDIQTTHESNLWEKLAEKHGFELVEASNTKVTFYDKKYETPIRFNISKNSDWIDYTNRGLKKRNMEEVLECYNSATPIQKRATPIIEIQGKSLDQGTVTISRDTFKLELFESAFYHKEGGGNDGNLKGAMHHEMWHCVDIRMTPEDEARVLLLLNSSKKGSAFKKSVTKDRRSKKKTGGQTFVSTYARQSGDRKIYEDFAESGAVMSSDTYLTQDALKGSGYIRITKEEFMKQYPNRASHIQDIIDNGELLW